MEDKDFIVVDAKRNSKIFDWALDYVEKNGTSWWNSSVRHLFPSPNCYYSRTPDR